MGYNSVIVILNDRLDEIEKDPKFGKKVVAAIRAYRRNDNPIMEVSITGQTQVVSVEHADVMQIIAVGANCGHVMGYGHWKQDDDAILESLNRDRLAKKRADRAKSST